MENKKNWKFKLPENIPKDFGKKLLRKDRIVILLLVGILLVVIAIPVPSGKNKSTDKSSGQSIAEQKTGTSEYSIYVERHLEEILSQVDGVGEVRAMVTLKTSSEKIIGKDKNSSSETVTEEDSQGGNRSTMSREETEAAIYENSQETPYITKEISPKIEGIVIIAEGGADAVTIRNITEAVQALFDIDTHKIKVMKLYKK